MATPIHVVVLKCRKILSDRKSVKLFVIYRTKNLGFFSNCHYCADRAQNLPGPAPNIWLTLFQIPSKSVHFRWSYSRTREGRFCPIEYFHDSLFEPIGLMIWNYHVFLWCIYGRAELLLFN